MPYMRISVEKYIFDRAEVVLKTMYVARDREVMDKFLKKRSKIVGVLSKEQIYEEVLLNKSIKGIQQ